MRWDGNGNGETSTVMGMGIGNFSWKFCEDGKFLTVTGYGWGKFDGAGDNIIYHVTL